MAGTVLLTGANGSAGLHASEHLLKAYPQYTAVFTVRNAADSDVNTKALRDVIARYPEAKASVHELDLSSLDAVHQFASTLSAAIGAGQYPPLKSIICNAYYWNLVDQPQLSVDGYEKTMQVSHISHVALVLRLLDRFGPDGGRVELVSSIVHYNKKNPMSNYLPGIPTDMDLLVRPPSDPDVQGRGFQRYANAKLAITIWMYPLNRYLQKEASLSNITAVAINPGNLGDSRAFTTNVPVSIQRMQKFLMKPLMPLVRRLIDHAFRPSSEAGVDMVELGVNTKYDGERGYYTLLTKDEPDPVVLDEQTQQLVWAKSAEWAKITKDNTALKAAFE